MNVKEKLRSIGAAALEYSYGIGGGILLLGVVFMASRIVQRIIEP